MDNDMTTKDMGRLPMVNMRAREMEKLQKEKSTFTAGTYFRARCVPSTVILKE